MDELESNIKLKASEYAKSLGMMSLKLNVKGQTGWPDRLYIWNGHVLFIEYKAAKQKPRPLQLYMHEQMRKAGAVVLVIDNLIDARSAIDELHQLPPIRP